MTTIIVLIVALIGLIITTKVIDYYNEKEIIFEMEEDEEADR